MVSVSSVLHGTRKDDVSSKNKEDCNVLGNGESAIRWLGVHRDER